MLTKVGTLFQKRLEVKTHKEKQLKVTCSAKKLKKKGGKNKWHYSCYVVILFNLVSDHFTDLIS